ncbi:zf-DHHC-domain-containing protein [Hypoxylon trugodes]|uniref:zf-DHHC-domain-containing protein n=1 Tax=Hypoxylon trugodes TaxID=326681 RepID=UPI002199D757|nr:zf-DHHC-domain-containing protein [Hypoxylon trugodes]KAI1383875.1 zf-DHHC-domain-containing protein [Hypoxylon trugodes]
MAFLVGSAEPTLQRLAVPAVCLLIAFLAYTSQWLFANSPDLAPGPLTTTETYTFNTLLVCLWYTYYKACTVDSGRYVFPSNIKKKQKQKKEKDHDDSDAEAATTAYISEVGDGARRGQLRRWCRKCAAPKPPRAHHCRTCRRCVPKMDHHCPWTSNCVSLQTFPQFLRFLVYTNISLWTLLYFLAQRFLALWDVRHLPAYLGPTLSQLAFLTVLSFVTGMTSLALAILLFTTLKGWVLNMTMIESWEVERHEAALERRYHSSSDTWWSSNERAPGGDRDAPHLTLEPVEFPYDIGFFANMAAAMGTSNPLFWFLPFAGGPVVAPYPYDDENPQASNNNTTGWEYEENGMNDREGLWPPADPDKLRHAKTWRDRQREADRALELERYDRSQGDLVDEKEAFRRRQERDLRRWEASRSRILGELEELPPGSYDDYDFVDEVYDHPSTLGRDQGMGIRRPRPDAAVIADEGKSGWVNADGEQLGDYGVDEDAEFDEPPQEIIHNVEDEDVPLAELIRRRKVRTKDDEDT